MSQILIMGGSRFIGRTLVEKLDTAGHDLTVINRGTIPNDEYLPSSATHYALDRNDKDAMKKALDGLEFDIVYDVSILSGEQAEILLDNIEGNVKRHVHVSTGSVYKIEKDIVLRLPIPESDATYPTGPVGEDVHPYMHAKRTAENVLWKAHLERSYPVTFVRPTFVYGPYNYIYREHYFFDRISQDRPILLPNTGNGFQDLVYVEDLVDLMILVGESPAQKVVGEAFNGTTGNIMTANMFAATVAKILRKEADIIYLDMKEFGELGWPAEKIMYPYIPEGGAFIDARKIEQKLAFTSQRSYEEGLTRTYEWWKDHGKKESDFTAEDALIHYIKLKQMDDPNPEDIKKARDDLDYQIEQVKSKIEKSKQKQQH